MKANRILSVALLSALAVGVLAQAPFTIIRPAEGARVREVVKVHLPKNSVPQGGYLSIWVDDGKEKRFLEATLPEAKGDVYEYLLDTKKLRLPDGPCTIEVVLYGPSGVIDSSKVNVTIANQQEITVPKAGAVLKYRYRPNTSWVYDVKATLSLLSISLEEEQRGATAAEQILIEDRFPLEYSIYNVYPNGNGLLRSRPLLDESGTIVFQRPGGGFDVVTDDQLNSIFLEVNPFGRRLYMSSPGYADPLGSSGSSAGHLVLLPLPTLPTEPQELGGTWSARTEIPADYHGNRNTIATVAEIPTKATLVAFEWEQNRPCAHIRYEFAVGKLADQKAVTIKGTAIPDAQVSVVQDVWFAMDIGAVVKSDLVMTVQGTSGGAGMTGGEATSGPRGTRGGTRGTRGPTAGTGPRSEDEDYGPSGPGPGMIGPSAMSPGGAGGAEMTGGGLTGMGDGRLRVRMRVQMVLRN